MFKLLVVEDDKELNRAVCSFLKRNGYDALGCLSANEAYDALYGGNVFDLIISDIMMPEVDGFEFALTIRGTDKNIPILFLLRLPALRHNLRQIRIKIRLTRCQNTVILCFDIVSLLLLKRRSI